MTPAVETPSRSTSSWAWPSSCPGGLRRAIVGLGRRRTVRWALPLALAVLAGATACATAPDPAPRTPGSPNDPSSSRPPSPSRTAGPPTDTDGTQTPAGPPSAEGSTAIRVIVGDEAFTAELYDNPTARDLAGRLPVTLTVDDLNAVEKTGRLPFALTTNGVPRGADPKVDEIGYYAPGRNLVLYYGDVGYFDGIIRIGRFEDSIEGIGDLADGLTVTVERA